MLRNSLILLVQKQRRHFKGKRNPPSFLPTDTLLDPKIHMSVRAQREARAVGSTQTGFVCEPVTLPLRRGPQGIGLPRPGRKRTGEEARELPSIVDTCPWGICRNKGLEPAPCPSMAESGSKSRQDGCTRTDLLQRGRWPVPRPPLLAHRPLLPAMCFSLGFACH